MTTQPIPIDHVRATQVESWTHAWTKQLVAAQKGDTSQMGSLYEEMKPWLIKRLRSCEHTRGLFLVPEDVDDAIQDAVVHALTHLKTFDPKRGTAAAWLWVLTRNCAITILRRRTRRHTVSLFPVDRLRPRAVVVPEGDPAACAERAEEIRVVRERLERVLATADQKVRRAWELRYLHGKAYAEIAAELGTPLGTLATWMFRLKKAVRRPA